MSKKDYLLTSADAEAIISNHMYKAQLRKFYLMIKTKEQEFITTLLNSEEQFEEITEFAFKIDETWHSEMVSSQLENGCSQFLNIFPKLSKLVVMNASVNSRLTAKMLRYFENIDMIPRDFKSQTANFYAVTVKEKYIIAIGSNRYEVTTGNFDKFIGTTLLQSDTDEAWFQIDILFLFNTKNTVRKISTKAEVLSKTPCLLVSMTNIYSVFYRNTSADLSSEGESFNYFLRYCKTRAFLEIKNGIRTSSLVPIKNLKGIYLTDVNKAALKSISDEVWLTLTELTIYLNKGSLESIFNKFKKCIFLDTLDLMLIPKEKRDSPKYDEKCIDFLEKLPNI